MVRLKRLKVHQFEHEGTSIMGCLRRPGLLHNRGQEGALGGIGSAGGGGWVQGSGSGLRNVLVTSGVLADPFICSDQLSSDQRG